MTRVSLKAVTIETCCPCIFLHLQAFHLRIAVSILIETELKIYKNNDRNYDRIAEQIFSTLIALNSIKYLNHFSTNRFFSPVIISTLSAPKAILNVKTF